MERRTFLKGVALAPLAAATGARAAAPRERAPGAEWRVFEVTTLVELARAAAPVRVWVPVPLLEDTDYQKSLGTTWKADGAQVALVVERRYGAGILCAEWPAPARDARLAVVSRFAARDRVVDLGGPRRTAREDRALLWLNLQPTELIPTDGIVRDTAYRITRGARGELEKARAIYDWIVDNTFRDPKVRGCGWGEVKAMLETGNLGGKCADLNALFVGLARAAGIPARDVYGLRVAPSRAGYVSLGATSADVSKAQHCRAEFYARGYGWVPVDPADVRKVALEEPPGRLALGDERVARARALLFGAWEMNWLAYNYAHDVRLPGSSGARLPYFMYPNGETAAGRLDSLDPEGFRYTIRARELTAA